MVERGVFKGCEWHEATITVVLMRLTKGQNSLELTTVARLSQTTGPGLPSHHHHRAINVPSFSFHQCNVVFKCGFTQSNYNIMTGILCCLARRASSMNAVEQNVSGLGQAQICWWLGCSQAVLIFSKYMSKWKLIKSLRSLKTKKWKLFHQQQLSKLLCCDWMK